MKIGIVGAGAVGSACIMSIIGRSFANELVLIDKKPARAEGVVTDVKYGMSAWSHIRLNVGDYDDLHETQLVIVSAGLNEKAGGAADRNDPLGRMRLLGPNAAVIGDIMPRLAKLTPKAVVLIVTNPPEPLAELARQIDMGRQVLSAGTLIDSLRFRLHVAERFGIHPSQVDAQAIGEHGNSRVLLWSSVRVIGKQLSSLLAADEMETFKREVEEKVRNANLSIIEGTGASQYGIGLACARIAEAIARDEHSVFPLGAYHADFGTTVALPAVIGRHGLVRHEMPDMSEFERHELERCADAVRTAVRQLT